MFELRLERTFSAPPEQLFAAWTTPELLRRWGGPGGLTLTEAELDLRVGGSWRVVVTEPDGTPHESFGTYRVVSPPDRVVYTHAWRRSRGSSPETLLGLELVPDGDRTRLVLTQTGFHTVAACDAHEEGWASTLDQLEPLLRELEPTLSGRRGDPAGAAARGGWRRSGTAAAP